MRTNVPGSKSQFLNAAHANELTGIILILKYKYTSVGGTDNIPQRGIYGSNFSSQCLISAAIRSVCNAVRFVVGMNVAVMNGVVHFCVFIHRYKPHVFCVRLDLISMIEANSNISLGLPRRNVQN